MNSRSFTNIVRYFMDEWLPPAIRDSKFFMFPFYYYAYKGRNIKTVMNLKSTIFKWSEKEFSNFYSNRDTRFSNTRQTDMSKQCLKYVFEEIKSDNQTFIDVGCGNGFLLEYANKKGFKTTGCDIIGGKSFDHSDYFQANIEDLPFEDNSFDVVFSTHTLEHVIDFEKAVRELKRITKKTLCVVVPCQRAYYYTLDEHVRFFPYKWMLEQEMKMKYYSCEKIHGDLVFIGDIEKEKSNDFN
ncbi:class I SAM-dependent methyltransferase [uncultured Aquimarina sp.]|uniref:class I SAM-dependent methyltransferase n=1 Tax=uncultured Aquimarina sp. TaxID=575652 RepID=UPI002614ED6B|nr:class I SAM-dependent methyltransferase [uncultured Aquimarina sp.]